MAEEKQKILNVPNMLTMLRMLLIPVYWIIFLRGYMIAALCVFVIASLTDLLDGYIARKYHLITDFGKLMDPLADKLMVISVMLSMALKGIVPWTPLIVLIAKEALMVLGGMALLKTGIVVYSKWIGKIAQLLVVVSLILCFFYEYFPAGLPLHLITLWIAVGLTLCALVFYAVNAIRLLKNAKAKNSEKSV